MRLLPFVAVVLVLAEAGAAVVLLLSGPWLAGLFLAVMATCTVALLAHARRATRRPPPSEGYVEREFRGF